MPVYLVNMRDKSITFQCNKRTWAGLLELAERYGWRPQGARWVERPDEPAISPYDASILAPEDTYQFDYGFFVMVEDARAMSHALGPACRDTTSSKWSLKNTPDLSKCVEFVKFTRQGAFEIK